MLSSCDGLLPPLVLTLEETQLSISVEQYRWPADQNPTSEATQASATSQWTILAGRRGQDSIFYHRIQHFEVLECCSG